VSRSRKLGPAKQKAEPPTKAERKTRPEEMARDAIAHEEEAPGGKVRMTFRVVLSRQVAEALAARYPGGEKHRCPGDGDSRGGGREEPGMNRRAFLGTLTGSLLAAPLAAEAQQAGRVYRIGVLMNKASDPAESRQWRGLWLGLRERGWI